MARIATGSGTDNVLFTFDLVRATTDPDQPIDSGPVTWDQFRHELNVFDWGKQCKTAVWANKGAPGMVVRNTTDKSMLRLHVYNLALQSWPGIDIPDDFTLTFVVGLQNGPMPPDIYALDGGKLATSYFAAYDTGTVKKLFRLYFRSDYEPLYGELFRLSVASVTE